MDLAKKRKADENGTSYPLHGSSVPDPTAADVSVIPSHLTLEDVTKILEPLTREQLFPIIHSAVLGHPDVLDGVRAVADPDPVRRKLFVRGLGWETTTEKLKAVFSGYGELEEGIVITDKNTGKSKGYGFVTFKHIDGAVLALKEPNKKIDGRITVTQLAAAGTSSADVASRKIYVGNIPFEISSDRLLSYFSSYGEIEEGPLGFDKQTGKAKGFAFFVYKTEDGARASMAEPVKIIDGHQVVCKLATDNKKLKLPTPNMGPGGMIGMPNGGPPGMPGDGNFGVQGGYGGYGAFPGGMAPGMPQQPQPTVMAQAPQLSTGIAGPGGAGGYGNQGPGFGVGGYGQTGAPYGTPGGATGDYSGTGSLSNAAGGYRMPSSMPGSTGYEGQNYGMTSTYPSHISQQGGGPRGPPGGMYQGMAPYY